MNNTWFKIKFFVISFLSILLSIFIFTFRKLSELFDYLTDLLSSLNQILVGVNSRALESIKPKNETSEV